MNLPVIRENAESERHEDETEMSPVTDPSISPSQEDDLTVTSYQGQELDPTKVIDIFVEMKDCSKIHLARYEGWRFKLFDPFDVLQARQLQLTDRRQVVARFPHEESRVLIDKWPSNINRFLEHPWHGSVTFFEAKGPPRPFNVFGQVPDRGGQHSRPRGPEPPPGPPPGGAAPSSSSTGDTSLGPTAADFRQRAGGAYEVVSAKQERQPVEFSLSATDDDGRWDEAGVMNVGAKDGDVQKSRHVSQVEHGVGQKGVRPNRSFNASIDNMARKKVISAAASSLQASIYDLVNEEDKEDLPKKKMGSKKCVAAWTRIVMAILLMIRTTRQQMVLDYLQKKGAEEDDMDKVNVGEKKKKPTMAKPKVTKTEWIPQGIGQPLKRSTTQKYWDKEPEDCQHPAEYLRCRANRGQRWWTCLTCGSRWERLEGDRTASSTTTVVPETPESAKLMTKTGAYPQYLPAPKSKPEQGAVQLKVNRMGMIATASGAAGSSQGPIPKSIPVTPPGSTARERSQSKKRQMEGLRAYQEQKDSTLQPGPREPRLPGARDGADAQRGSHGGGERRGARVTARILADKSQLSGKFVSSLKSTLASRFSKFVVFLCMNCCLPPSTVSAFGTPDLVAWHRGNEFDFQHGFTEPDVEQRQTPMPNFGH
eukprot:s33_g72.t1